MPRIRIICFFRYFLIFIAITLHAAAQSGLKTINPPQGGKIVYGQVDGQTTEAGAMAAILRSLHQSLGERPQVGKLFQVRGSESVAAFFSVSRADQRTAQKSMQIAGLIIATKPDSDHVEAALVSDEASRFPKTLGPMMKSLFAAWHPLHAQSSGGSASPVAPLHQLVTSDRSAAISVPDGWQLVPKMSMMGSIVAAGPQGEFAELGTTFLAGDTNNPQVQRLMAQLRAGQLRNTMYASATYYPYGADPAQTFVYLMQNLRHKAGLGQATYSFTSATAVPGSGQQRCTHLVGSVNLNDGKGAKELNALFCSTPPGRAGTWMSSAYTTTAPMQIAARERATLGAILASFQVDQQVVARQANQIAAPAIEQIHAIGRAAAEQARSAHEREEIHNSSVYQHWDSMDKRSQEFENYQLGYSVIATTDNQYHGTFWNEDADALVKSNPDKFEYVTAPNYWKGIDY